MNKILGIKLPFNHEPNYVKPGPKNLKKHNIVSSNHLVSLIENLKRIKDYYSSIERFTSGILIDVCYNDIIAKSGRMTELLKEKHDCNETIVGARFSDSLEQQENHIITHYISINALNMGIKKLEIAIQFLNRELNGTATSDNFKADNTSINYEGYEYSKNKLRNIIIDCSVIESFAIPNAAKTDVSKENMVITFFNTELNLDDLFNKIGLERNKYYYNHAGKNTISAPAETYQFLINRIPYLISMAASDLSELTLNDIINDVADKEMSIPVPANEPTIGVIDTLFDDTVYFHQWVDYREKLTFIEEMTKRKEHYEHGTAVSSLIVDGPTLNPWLDDGLGRFKVRHFGVCPGRISPTSLVQKIKEIINENQDIHVWNLSLGTEDEVSRNFISFDAAAIDEIQQQKNVIFVVAGTNDTREIRNGIQRIGSPADSLNSIVVNSVKRDGSPASYTRSGKVLSFFNKPDISYYGGDYEDDERLYVYTNKGRDKQYGTSLAAPWISRKLCYLIDVLGLPREVAKALIIDSAAGWEYKQRTYKQQHLLGYGIVPKNINDILSTENSEIKFILQGTANSYTTSNYAIPVPKDENDKFPFVARATLCYFPECSRLEGVDYSQRELSLKFGRINGKGIVDINKNIQDTEGEYSDERKARKDFRKWENTKFISSLYKPKTARALTSYGEGLWGITLTSKERRRTAKQDNLNFGIVVTIKNIKGVNQINLFKHACLLRGYIVNEINITNQIEIYEKAQAEIEFE